MDYRQRTYIITSQIPKGKVLSYKALAILAGVPNPRLVGMYLHQNPHKNIPCYRVVNSQGKIAKTYAFGGGDIQKQKLQSDGIVFTKDKINLKQYLWKPKFEKIKQLQNLFNQDFESVISSS